MVRSRGKSHLAGALLIEVIIGIIILTIVFPALAANWIYNERSLKKHRDYNAARYLLGQEMENTLAQKYSLLVNGTVHRSIIFNREIDGVTVGQTFEIERTIKEDNGKKIKNIVFVIRFVEENEQKNLNARARVYFGHQEFL